MKKMLFNAADPLFNPMVNTSIPQYVEKEDSQTGIIKWGIDNKYPEYLKSLLNKSAKHSAIVKGKAAMIGGNGWSNNNLSVNAHNFLGNPYGTEDLDAILSKISYDNEIYGGFCLNIIWSKDRSMISKINYIDPSKIRVAVPNFNKNGWEPVDSYWYCDDWKNTRKYKPVLIQGFSTQDKSEASQIVFVKDYRPGTEWYMQPEYLASVNWIELEWEISQFHLKNVKNGFHPSMIINFTQGIPNEEEQDFLIRNMRKEYEGAMNSGKVIFTFSEDKDGAPVITPIDLNASDEKFIQLNDSVTEGIFVGHRITDPTLFGIKVAGELGNSKSYVDAMRVFQAMYVDSKQNMIEKIFNRLAAINGVTDKLMINKQQIELDIDVNTNDVLSVLGSNLSQNQKHQIFIAMGYTEEMAKKLVNG